MMVTTNAQNLNFAADPDEYVKKNVATLIREVCSEVGAAMLLVSHDEEVLAQFERRQDFAALNTPAALASGGAGSGRAQP